MYFVTLWVIDCSEIKANILMNLQRYEDNCIYILNLVEASNVSNSSNQGT